MPQCGQALWEDDLGLDSSQLLVFGLQATLAPRLLALRLFDIELRIVPLPSVVLRPLDLD